MRHMGVVRSMAARVRDLAFFAVFFTYVWVGIDTRLTLNWQGRVFSTMPGFLGGFLAYPGGPADYLYSLVAQAYASQIWGAVVLTALAAASAALTHAYFKALAGRAVPGVRYVTAFLLLGYANLYGDFTPLLLELPLALGLAIAFLAVSRTWRNAAVRIAVFLALSGAAYYFGGLALVLFALMAAAAQLARRGAILPRLTGIVYLALAAAIPAAIELRKLIPIPSSAMEWFPRAPRQATVYWGLYVFFGAATAVAVRLRAAAPAPQPAPAEAPEPAPEEAAAQGSAQSGRGKTNRLQSRKREAAKSARPSFQWKRPLLSFLATVLLLAGLGAAAEVGYRLSAEERTVELLDYAFSRGDWDAVADLGLRLPVGDFNEVTGYEIDRALHEANRLGDEMFHYPQGRSMLLPLSVYSDRNLVLKAEMCLRLGRVNDAEIFGYNQLVLGRSDARFYRLMAQINLVKGQTEVARKFLNVLSFDIAGRAWARERLDELARDPQLLNDSEIGLLRRRMLRTDDMIPVWQTGADGADMRRLLADQLRQDPTNRMAFEFLIGLCLLNHDLDGAASVMADIRNIDGPAYRDAYGRRRSPRHFQEAMAFHGVMKRQMPVIEGFQIDQDVIDQTAAFCRLMADSHNDRPAAMRAAWPYRNTYFFYYVFGPGDYR